jgi:hypothetical protein
LHVNVEYYPHNSVLSSFGQQVHSEINAIVGFVSQCISSQKKQTLVFSWLLFTSFGETPSAQNPIALSMEGTPQRFRFLSGVYKQVQV